MRTHLDLAVVACRQNDLPQSPLGLDHSLGRLQGFARLLLAELLPEAQLVDAPLHTQSNQLLQDLEFAALQLSLHRSRHIRESKLHCIGKMPHVHIWTYACKAEHEVPSQFEVNRHGGLEVPSAHLFASLCQTMMPDRQPRQCMVG